MKVRSNVIKPNYHFQSLAETLNVVESGHYHSSSLFLMSLNFP